MKIGEIWRRRESVVAGVSMNFEFCQSFNRCKLPDAVADKTQLLVADKNTQDSLYSYKKVYLLLTRTSNFAD